MEVNCNKNGHMRGMHVVVINRENGEVETAQCFDTHESSEQMEDFIE